MVNGDNEKFARNFEISASEQNARSFKVYCHNKNESEVYIMLFKGSFEFDSVIAAFRCISSKDFEDLKKRASRVYDDVIESDVKCDSTIRFICLHGLNGSWYDPKDYDLLGYQVIVKCPLP